MLKQRFKRIGIAFFIVLFLGIALLVFQYWISNSITAFDHPSGLSNKAQAIDVTYMNWACDCADFTEIATTDTENPENQLFIEAANDSLKAIENGYMKNYFQKYIRLTGQFYNDKGISRTYELKTNEKPDKARVFRYEKIEILTSRK